MAQISKRPDPSKRPNRAVGGASKSTQAPAKKTATRATSSSAGRPPTRKPGKSIVNQKQTPWGLIAIAVVLVLFAGGIVAYAVTRHKDSSSNSSAADAPYVQAEVPAAKAIKGIIWKKHVQHSHVTGVVKYDSSPPMGGNHNPYWANCTGTVYTKQIANENAVHMLEHGAIWITYNPKISAADLKTLRADVDGVQWMALSPYAGLKTMISLQAWNYQLFVDKASDPRIDAFIGALKHTPKVTPEYGAQCSGSGFVASQSYPGHPYNAG